MVGTGQLKGTVRYRWLPEEHQLLSVRGRLELSNDLQAIRDATLGTIETLEGANS